MSIYNRRNLQSGSKSENLIKVIKLNRSKLHRCPHRKKQITKTKPNQTKKPPNTIKVIDTESRLVTARGEDWGEKGVKT